MEKNNEHQSSKALHVDIMISSDVYVQFSSLQR